LSFVRFVVLILSFGHAPTAIVVLVPHLMVAKIEDRGLEGRHPTESPEAYRQAFHHSKIECGSCSSMRFSP
jgi:hypothetical protein